MFDKRPYEPDKNMAIYSHLFCSAYKRCHPLTWKTFQLMRSIKLPTVGVQKAIQSNDAKSYRKEKKNPQDHDVCDVI